MGDDGGRIGLLGLGAYLPERVMTNDEWTEWVDTSDEWIVQRTGIERRRIAADDESTVDLALSASRRALADAGVDATEVDEIIVATDTPEVRIPDTASYLQHRLGAGEVPAFDLAGSGCAGFLLALDVARSRVLSGRRRVLVVGVELLTRMMNWRDRSTAVLFGDAAAAALVGRLPEGERGVGEILSAVAGTDGSRTGILTLEAGGTREPISAEGVAAGRHKAVVMKGREVFREAVARMGQAAHQALELAGLPLSAVDLLIPHQANLRILQATAKSLDLPIERLFINVQEVGNTGSASVPLALAQARDEGKIAAGDLVLLTSFGAGLHWAAVLLRM